MNLPPEQTKKLPGRPRNFRFFRTYRHRDQVRVHSFNVFSFNIRKSSLLRYTFEPHLLRKGFIILYVEVMVSVTRSTQVHNLDR